MVKQKCPVRTYLLFLLDTAMSCQTGCYKVVYGRYNTLSRLSFMCNKIGRSGHKFAAKLRNINQTCNLAIGF